MGNASTFYKTGISNEVRLKLENAKDADQIVAYTEPNATAGVDVGLDAEKFVSRSTVDLAFINNSKGYGINALNTIDANTELPFDIAVTEAGIYTLSLTAYSVNGLIPFIKDNVTGILTNINSGNTMTLNLPANAQISGRYSVVFKTNTPNGIAEVQNAAHIFAHNNTLFVNRENSNPATIQVYNVMGQLINKIESTSALNAIDMNGATGSVIVRIAEGTKTQTQKLFLN